MVSATDYSHDPVSRLIDELGEEAVWKIVTEVAHREGVSPSELPPLYTALDTELIEMVPDSDTVQFPYQGDKVTVRSETAVTVQQPMEEDFALHA